MLLHGVVVLAGVVAYTVLTALGHDGNIVLASTLAWAGGGAVQAKLSNEGL